MHYALRKSFLLLNIKNRIMCTYVNISVFVIFGQWCTEIHFSGARGFIVSWLFYIWRYTHLPHKNINLLFFIFITCCHFISSVSLLGNALMPPICHYQRHLKSKCFVNCYCVCVCWCVNVNKSSSNQYFHIWFSGISH